MTARFYDRVFSSLRFEMIFRLAKRDAGTLLQMPQHFAWKIDMTIQTSADGRSTERKLAQSLDRFLGAFFGVNNLLRIAGKFLTEAYRCRVHQVGPADLDDLPKLLRFGFDRGMQFFQSRNETVFQLLRCADMDRRRNHVVARLSHVDVIVRMDRFA